MLEQLDELRKLLLFPRTAMELENISRDLHVLCRWIKSGEYRNTDFLERKSFDTPRRTYEFFNYLKGYHAHAVAWSERLKKISLAGINTIIDFCPGCSPKIQWALQLLGYRGLLYIIDKSPVMCEQLDSIMKVFNVAYDYTFIQDSIYSDIDMQADLVTANHIFDDLALDSYCSMQGLDLSSIYADEDAFRAVTTAIPETLDLELLCEKIYTSIHTKLKPGGFVMLTHYAGLTESALDLTQWSGYVMKLMNKTCNMFAANRYQLLDQTGDASQKYVLMRSMGSDP